MRSEPTENGHGHQAVYDENDILITEGISAGSADRMAPSLIAPRPHIDADVRPFIWALQLDGNPVQATGGFINIDQLVMYDGANTGKYFRLRPTIVPGSESLAPGVCQ